MNKLLSLLALVFCFQFGNSQSPQIFLSPQQVVAGGSTYGSVKPRIVLTRNNIPLVMWSRANGIIYSSRWNGSGFSAPVQVTPTGVLCYTNSNEGPHIAARGDTVFVSFFSLPMTSSKIYLVKSIDGGLTWQDTVRADHQPPATPGYTPAVAIDPLGNPYVVFEKATQTMQNPSQMCNRSTDGGQTFSMEVSANAPAPGIPCECCPPMILQKNNSVYVMYRNNINNLRNIHLTHSGDSGQSFTQNIQIDSTNWVLNGCPSAGPEAIWNGDSIFSVWMSQVGGNGRIILGRMHGGTLQSNRHRIIDYQNQMSIVQRHPSIAGSGDTLAVCWDDNRANSNISCFVSFSTSGVSGLGQSVVWLSDSVFSATGNQQVPSVAFGNGIFHFVFQSAFTNEVIYRKGTFTGLSVSETHQNLQVTIFPNPGSDFVFVQTSKPGFSYRMLDVKGQEIKSEVRVSGDQTELDIQDLPKGIYFFECNFGGERVVRKMVKL
jgi:hypothetical protein